MPHRSQLSHTLCFSRAVIILFSNRALVSNISLSVPLIDIYEINKHCVWALDRSID